MKKLLFASALVLLFSCKNNKEFSVEGTIAGSSKEVIYLEQIGMNGVNMLDSTKTNGDGEFSFSQNRPQFAPEFYRIRFKNQVINLSVDSTEEINIKTKADNFGNDYEVTGSVSSEEIKYFNQLATKTKISIDSLFELKTKNIISPDSFQTSMLSKIAHYKNVASRKIFQNPKSPASYFALLQRIYSYMIFDPSEKNDLKVFGAVATSFDFYYPESPRTKHLRDMTLQAMSARRQPKDLEISSDKLNVKGAFEIELHDMNGNLKKLSSLKGRPVVLCFTAYQTKFSPAFNMELGEIYSANKARGLEVFQVSVDNDENFWKVSAANLPWICVRDMEGVNSRYLQIFNVSDIPTIFLLNSQGDIVKRVTNLKSLKSEVGALK